MRLLSKVFKRKQHPKVGAQQICPVCHKHISYCDGNNKAKHFKEHHPEYPFIIEYPYWDSFFNMPSKQIRYRCAICELTFSSFDILVEKHKHKEATESGRAFSTTNTKGRTI